MKLRLRSPRDLARTLRAVARRRPEQVEQYLDDHVEEWSSLAEAAPGDAADILEQLGEAAASDLLAGLDRSEAAEILEELRPDLAAEILEEMNTERAAALLEAMNPESAVDVLEEIGEEAVSEILHQMERGAAEEIRELLIYPPDSAGGLMTTDVASLPVGMTAGEAIERIRQLHEELEDVSYVYVVDEGNRLVGVLSFRDLVFNRPGVGLDEAMVPQPVFVYPETDREEVAELIRRYHLFGIPVVDHDGTLLGMITTDSVIEAVQQEASEDFAAAVGAGVGESVYSPVGRSVKSRIPWNLTDIFLSSIVVFAISRFDRTLEAFTVLAALMPLVARIGGNAGAQSLAVVIRSLAADDIPGSEVGGVIAREVRIGAINGLPIGILSGLLGFIVHEVLGGDEPGQIALVMAVASWSNLVVASLAGSSIPLIMRRLGADPALASNLFLTALTDLMGFAGFLGVATLFLL